MKKTRRKKITTEKIIEMFKSIHGDKYDYSLVDYKTMHHKVIIICRKHGKFLQEPNQHFRKGCDCRKCIIDKIKISLKGNTKDFIEKANKIHNFKYDYSKTEYGNNAYDKLTITCKEHGDFETIPNRHLNGKVGCPDCGNKSHGWTKTSWGNACNGKIAIFYIIKCWNEEEEFYKFGITCISIVNRYGYFSKMPYNWEVIKSIESEDWENIYDLERKFKKENKNDKYIPKIYFAGFSECIKNYKEAH